MIRKLAASLADSCAASGEDGSAAQPEDYSQSGMVAQASSGHHDNVRPCSWEDPWCPAHSRDGNLQSSMGLLAKIRSISTKVKETCAELRCSRRAGVPQRSGKLPRLPKFASHPETANRW